MPKKIAIVGTVGLPAHYGGFETLTKYLSEYLDKEYDITVFCSEKQYSVYPDMYNNTHLKYINLNANGIQSIPYDMISIIKSLKFADTILILGVSGCTILPLIKMFSSKKIIVNIDGLEWKRAKWGIGAKLFLKFSEKLAVKYADIVITDNKIIQDYVQSEYHKESTLIVYGANHVEEEDLSDSIKEKHSVLNDKYALKVCRIEPENNIHLILEAFEEYDNLNLIIIGNWENSEYGTKLKTQYSKSKKIFLFNSIYNQKILNQIRSNCHIYMHGHSAGGTNPSLVEAMYLGLPIFSYAVQYNKETTRNQSLYFNDKDELIKLLKSTNEEKLRNVADKMKVIAEEYYTWKKITKQYSQLF